MQSLISLWTFNLTGFAVLYSTGAILSLCSTGFLMVRRVARACAPAGPAVLGRRRI
jgi:hypothetical protein